MKKFIVFLFAAIALYGCQSNFAEQPAENPANTRAAATLATPILASDDLQLIYYPPGYSGYAYLMQTGSGARIYATNYDSYATYEWSVNNVALGVQQLYDHGYFDMDDGNPVSFPYETVFPIKCRIHKNGDTSDWGTVYIYWSRTY
ncbi:MAG: hypothetical protein LBU97_02445 [Alistipes sp.]|jgi:hypothetical protein|nr:hypothetical protein [Alistipes sp.]